MSRRTVRVICPGCHEQRAARPSWVADPHLVVEPHDLTIGGLTSLDLDTLGARRCPGGGRRVGPEAMPPRPRPISYEETVRLIDTLLGTRGAA